MRRRTRRTLLIVAAFRLLLAADLFLRFQAPPEAACLLPEADGILYGGFKPVQSAAALGSRAHTCTTSNDARMSAWRVYENNHHAGR